MESPARARGQVLAFVAITFTASFALEGWMIARGGIEGPLRVLVPLIMWMPALVSFGLRLGFGEGFRDAGWRIPSLRHLATAWFLPLGVGGAAYAIAWTLGIGEFRQPEGERLGHLTPTGAFFAALGANGTLGVLVGSLFAAGEELGWRGYLLERLYRARIRPALFWSGVIWSLWHWPLILWGGYATSPHPWLSALQFLWAVSAVAVIIGWLRLASGSVWTAVWMHAAHNAFFQDLFMNFTQPGPLSPYLLGEAGIFPAILYTAVALWLWRTGRLAGLARAAGA